MAPLKVDVKVQNTESGEARLPKEICEVVGLADEGVLYADIHEAPPGCGRPSSSSGTCRSA